MRRLIVACVWLPWMTVVAEPEFPLTADSKPQACVPKGTLIEDTYTAGDGSVFPGTEREVKIYLPHGFDRDREWPFMVFQDGVIYQAPVVFDNLIAKKDIPPLVGIFIKPGVVPAASDNALPRFNRSYEYDSVTDTYARFLINGLLPALEAKHGFKLSADPNRAAIAGNSSGGICAFMAAWHRPDRFRRVFTGVGTYVGIRGADRLPVLIRKIEPKPLRVFLQSGTGDNNLYCGDWWMANQMMERSLAWAGYDVNHAWGEGGHNQKHATQVFPDALRWLWRDWQTDIEVKANPKGESKWRGYEVVGDGEWEAVVSDAQQIRSLASEVSGEIYAIDFRAGNWWRLSANEAPIIFSRGHLADDHGLAFTSFAATPKGLLVGTGPNNRDGISFIQGDGSTRSSDLSGGLQGFRLCVKHDGRAYMSRISDGIYGFDLNVEAAQIEWPELESSSLNAEFLSLSPDQSQLFVTFRNSHAVAVYSIGSDHRLQNKQAFFELEGGFDEDVSNGGLCVDTEGRLYVATSLGIQVCDQAGRVNFIIPTPKQPYDVCFGGKDLGELFIACGDTIYKRPAKVRGVVSGQMPPIKPAPPKL